MSLDAETLKNINETNMSLVSLEMSTVFGMQIQIESNTVEYTGHVSYALSMCVFTQNFGSEDKSYFSQGDLREHASTIVQKIIKGEI